MTPLAGAAPAGLAYDRVHDRGKSLAAEETIHGLVSESALYIGVLNHLKLVAAELGEYAKRGLQQGATQWVGGKGSAAEGENGGKCRL